MKLTDEQKQQVEQLIRSGKKLKAVSSETKITIHVLKEFISDYDELLSLVYSHNQKPEAHPKFKYSGGEGRVCVGHGKKCDYDQFTQNKNICNGCMSTSEIKREISKEVVVVASFFPKPYKSHLFSWDDAKKMDIRSNWEKVYLPSITDTTLVGCKVKTPRKGVISF